MLAVLPIVAVPAAAADAPDVGTIVAHVKAYLEPEKPSLRKMTLTVTQADTTSKMILGQARGKVADRNRILTVALAPNEVRGIAYLVEEEPAADDNRQWTYLPSIGRVRVLISPEAFTSFMDSDFTYADLSFTPLHSKYTLLGEDTGASAHVYRVEEVPAHNWYYSRIVDTVEADSFRPLERQFYDPANQPWKVEHFEATGTIGGVPTVITTVMEDMLHKSRSTFSITDLQYDAELPEGLLEPKGLAGAATSPVWTSLNAPVGR